MSDPISRDDAIKAFEEEKQKAKDIRDDFAKFPDSVFEQSIYNEAVKAWRTAINIVKNLPTVDAVQEQRWILCSERMPEDLEEVNVTWVNHDPEPYYNFVKDKPFTGSAVYYKEKWYWYSSTTEDFLAEYGRYEGEEFDEAIEVVAWMPLPEPYREDGEADGDG